MKEWIVTDNDEEFYKRNNVPELIRCKDCMFYSKELEACWESEYEDLRRWKSDDFCSKGERKRRMKEVIVNAEDLVCLNKEKLQELIRCKDCKFYHKTEDDQFCGQGSVVAFDERYCSIAERKEE